MAPNWGHLPLMKPTPLPGTLFDEQQLVYRNLWDDLLALLPYLPGRFLDWSLLPQPMLAAQVYGGHSQALTLPVLTRTHPANVSFNEANLLTALHEELAASKIHLLYVFDSHQPSEQRFALKLTRQTTEVEVRSASLSFGLVSALKKLYLPTCIN